MRKNTLIFFIFCFFCSLAAQEPKPDLTIEENLYEGAVLKLSDGSTWEVSPDDQTITQIWLFSFPVKVGQSNDPTYPYYIENENSKTQVHVRPISKKELKKIEKKHQHKTPAPQYRYQPSAPPTPQPLTP